MPVGERLEERFRVLLGESFGLRIGRDDVGRLQRALGVARRDLGIHSLHDLWSAIRSGGARADRARNVIVSEFVVGETHFFRNRAQFGAIETQILPDIISSNAERRTLRVWSAGCATGEETYSLAILIDMLLPDRATWDVTITGTDLDERALSKARSGSYRSWSFREVPEPVKASWFTEVDGRFEVLPRVRQMVTFAQMNLVNGGGAFDSRFEDVDLVMCCNLLLYLEPDACRQAVARLYQALAPGGWLLVAPTDPEPSRFEDFVVVDLPGGLGFRKPGTSHPPADGAPTPTTTQVAPIEPATRLRQRMRDQSRSQKGQSAGADAIEDAGAACRRARIQADQGNLDEAERSVQEALVLDPLSPEAHYLNGLILQERGDREEALAAFRRCVYNGSGHLAGLLALGGLLVYFGAADRARLVLAEVATRAASRPSSEAASEHGKLTYGEILDLAHAQLSILSAQESRRDA